MADPTRPRRRPERWSDVRFEPQRSVRWFSPSVLAHAGLRVVFSGMFGAWLDKRELQDSLGDTLFTQHAGRDELWFDYVADTGDGFDATYTVAWLAAQASLDVAGADAPLPRADVLVLGGDEVYPVANAQAYQDRFIGPYQAALPWTAAPSPELWAIPGNHDWYDGLTSFLRMIGQRAWIGGRQTLQERSYFALQLPHRWWLWGIDIQFDAYVDAPQVRYFERAAEQMQPGDRVVLCTAVPSWIDLPVEPEAYRNLAFIERKVIRPHGGRVALTLSGDSHHYARYVGDDGTERVTAGGGGAFLHPTHNLPPGFSVSVDPDEIEAPAVVHRRLTRYPSAGRSRRLLLGCLALPWRNPSFVAVPALVHVLLLWANQFGLRSLDRQGQSLAEAAPDLGFLDLLGGLFRNPFSLFTVLVFAAALVAFAKPPPRWCRSGWPKLAGKVALGGAHAIAQLAAVAAVALFGLAVLPDDAGGPFVVVAATVIVGLVGGVGSGVVFGAYLALANLPSWGSHGNEAFSSMRRTRYKNFLRCHLDTDGALTVWAIGVDRSCERWRFDPHSTDPSASWLAPAAGPPEPLLVETFDFPPTRPAPSAP